MEGKLGICQEGWLLFKLNIHNYNNKMTEDNTQLSRNICEVKYQVLSELFDRVKKRQRGFKKLVGILSEQDSKEIVEIMGDVFGLSLQREVYMGNSRVTSQELSMFAMEIGHYLSQFRNTGVWAFGEFPREYQRVQLSW